MARRKVFLTVLITKSKDSKWGHYDDLASMGGFRKMSALCFARAWLCTHEMAAEKEELLKCRVT